jgi:hypothetical protein
MASAPQDISRSLQAFAAGFHEQGKQLSELQSSSPATFQHVILSLLLEARDTPRFRFLIAYLSSRGLLPQCVQALRRKDRGLAALVVELAERMLPDGTLLAPASKGAGPELDASYLLGLLEAFSTGLNLLTLHTGAMDGLDERLRARLAAILGKAARTHDVFLALVTDGDPRVRANAVESLWGSTSAMAREVFEKAARDAHHRVAANALVGQYLQGRPESVAGFVSMIRRQDQASRAAAAWAMGRVGDERFVPLLHATRRLPGQDPPVVRNCLAAIKRIQHNSAGVEVVDLAVRILDVHRAEGDRATLLVSAQPIKPQAPVSLPGTAFRIQAGDRPVWEYHSEEVRAERPVAVAFILPVGLEGMRAKARAYRALLGAAFQRRREADRIALALYAETPMQSPTVLYGPTPLTSEEAEIQNTLADLPGPANVPQGPFEVIAEVIEGMRGFEGERHIVWVVDQLSPAFLDRAALPPLAGIRLHVVCSPEVPLSAQRSTVGLARAAGGFSLHLEKEDDLGAACEDVVRSLYQHYRLTCLAPKEQARWLVEVSSGEYRGKSFN